MSKFCGNCGKELNDGAVFCGGCGMSLAVKKNENTAAAVTPVLSYKSAEGPNGTILFSPQPLEDKLAGIHKVVWTIIIVQWVVLTVALFSYGGFFWGIAIGLAIKRIEVNNYVALTDALRREKFQFVGGVSNEQLFTDMNGIFSGKYNYTVEINKKGLVEISDGSMRYEITIEEDNSFTIWYSMPIKKVLLSFNDYGDYKKIIAAMGIIGYEIQRRYGVNYFDSSRGQELHS